LWLYRIWRQRFAGLGCAKTTTSGTYIAQNHECGSSLAPTFGLIRASSAAANRMERVFTHYASNLRKSITSVESYFQPIRLSRWCIFTIQLRHFLLSSLFLLVQRYKFFFSFESDALKIYNFLDINAIDKFAKGVERAKVYDF
jgi:hypothetical protein